MYSDIFFFRDPEKVFIIGKNRNKAMRYAAAFIWIVFLLSLAYEGITRLIPVLRMMSN